MCVCVRKDHRCLYASCQHCVYACVYLWVCLLEICVCTTWDSCFSQCPLQPHTHRPPATLCKGQSSTPPGHARVSKQTYPPPFQTPGISHCLTKGDVRIRWHPKNSHTHAYTHLQAGFFTTRYNDVRLDESWTVWSFFFFFHTFCWHECVCMMKEVAL